MEALTACGRASGPVPPGFDPPPPRGLPLAWRLALATCASVAFVMGGLTYSQRREAYAGQRRAREALLVKGLAPLVARLERAKDAAAARRELAGFHSAYLQRGHDDHQLALRGPGGEVVAASFDAVPRGPDIVRGAVEVSVPYLPAGSGVLEVYEHAPELKLAAAREWRAWALHLAATTLVIMAVLGWTIHRLVSRPLRSLLADVRRMELGYWGDVGPSTGAWEVAWLSWRFRSLGRELEASVARLVAAERLAAEARAGLHRADPSAEDVPEVPCGSPPPAAALELADGSWEAEAAEAERLGDHGRKARIEEAAAARIDPEGLERVRRLSVALRWGRRRGARAALERLLRGLDAEGVPCAAVESRYKRPAAVWRKMRAKGLTLEQVHDWFAVRIVVPTESDCYWALGTIHRAFEALPGRFDDYIAEPKPSGYRGIHTCVRGEAGFPFEVQIRSVAMDREAEVGQAAHWRYKAVSSGGEA